MRDNPTAIKALFDLRQRDVSVPLHRFKLAAVSTTTSSHPLNGGAQSAATAALSESENAALAATGAPYIPATCVSVGDVVSD